MAAQDNKHSIYVNKEQMDAFKTNVEELYGEGKVSLIIRMLIADFNTSAEEGDIPYTAEQVLRAK